MPEDPLARHLRNAVGAAKMLGDTVETTRDAIVTLGEQIRSPMPTITSRLGLAQIRKQSCTHSLKR